MINSPQDFEKRVAEVGCSTAYRSDDDAHDFYRGLAVGAFIISAAIGVSLVYLYNEFNTAPARDGCIVSKSEIMERGK